MATIAPGSTQGFNPLGFLVPAFQGLLQGQELGRERQDLQNLRIHQQALGQAPGANAQLPAFQSQKFRGFQAQNLFQNLGLANQAITPAQERGFGIQEEANRIRLQSAGQVSPTQERAQAQAEQFRRFIAIPKENRTPPEQAFIDRFLSPSGPAQTSVTVNTGVTGLTAAENAVQMKEFLVEADRLNKENPDSLQQFSVKTNALGVPSIAIEPRKTQPQIDKDLIDAGQSIAGLEKLMGNFDRNFLTVGGKMGAWFQKWGDLLNVPGVFGTEWLAKQQEFKSSAKRQFLIYRRAITGVAGGVQEFQEIAKAFPDIDKMSPTQFQAAGKAAIDDGNRIVSFLDALKTSGQTINKENIDNALKAARETLGPDADPRDIIDSAMESISPTSFDTKTGNPNDIARMTDEQFLATFGAGEPEQAGPNVPFNPQAALQGQPASVGQFQPPVNSQANLQSNIRLVDPGRIKTIDTLSDIQRSRVWQRISAIPLREFNALKSKQRQQRIDEIIRLSRFGGAGGSF